MEGGRAPCLNECVAVQLIWGKRHPVRPGGQRERNGETRSGERNRANEEGEGGPARTDGESPANLAANAASTSELCPLRPYALSHLVPRGAVRRASRADGGPTRAAARAAGRRPSRK